MKKRVVTALLMITIAASMIAGCAKTGNAGEGTTTASTEMAAAEESWANEKTAYLSGLNPSDYIKLGDYKNMQLTIEGTRVITNDTVEAAVQRELSYYQEQEEVTDRTTVESGDIVNIDYEGKLDGEAFDGGTATDYDLTIGSGSFIDGFEDQIIGHEKGETFDINVTFPEGYAESSLAGKETTFTITINKIQNSILPELNDEFVQGLHLTMEDGTEVNDVDGFYAYERAVLEQENEDTRESYIESAISSWIQSNCETKKDLPEAMVERYVSSYMSSLETMANAYGVDIKTLVTYYGYEEDSYAEGIREDAEREIVTLLSMAAIAQKEGIEVTDEEFEKSALEEGGYSSLDDLSNDEKESYREYLLVRKTKEFLKGQASITENGTEVSGSANLEAASEGETGEDAAETEITPDQAAAEAEAAEETEAEVPGGREIEIKQ